MITARVGAAVVLFDGSQWSGPPVLIEHLNTLTPLALESVPTSDPFPDLRLALEVLKLYGDGSIETAVEDPPDVEPGTRPEPITVF